tara:strand:- start:415 stop:621 length:207 start_codon:yes stop_codon:yes gene_type:complete
VLTRAAASALISGAADTITPHTDQASSTVKAVFASNSVDNDGNWKNIVGDVDFHAHHYTSWCPLNVAL